MVTSSPLHRRRSSPALTRLATVLSVGMALGDEANRIIGDWQTVVKPAPTNLGKTLKSALDGAEAVLDINSLLGGKTAPTFDLSVLMTRLALVLAAGMALGTRLTRSLVHGRLSLSPPWTTWVKRSSLAWTWRPRFWTSQTFSRTARPGLRHAAARSQD